MFAVSRSDDIDAIAHALARVRGRGRGPRGPFGRGGPFDIQDHDAPGGPQPQPRGRGPHDGRRFGGPALMRLVETLAAAEAPLGVGAIGEAIGVDQPRASRLVQQAAERGLVAREADPRDARRTRIALTDRGRGFARGVRGERREALGTALRQFTDEERAELARLLDKLATHWPE